MIIIELTYLKQEKCTHNFENEKGNVTSKHQAHRKSNVSLSNLGNTHVYPVELLKDNLLK